MIYCLISIGVIGYFVWAFPLMGLFFINLLGLFIYKEVINFAICGNSLTLLSTLNSKNLSNYTQSAGNLINRSTSETTREISFNYDLFYKKYHQQIDYNWLTWFIGFSEGDGCITAYNNRCKFIITQKESKILDHIQEVLQIGKVTLRKDGYYSYTVNNKSDIMLLASIFNGNLYLDYRIKQLSLWFSILNIDNFISKPCIPSLNDAWISGFTDAEGCFTASVYKRNDSDASAYRIRLRYILDQNNFKNNFIHIAALFNSGFISVRPNTTHQFRFTINSYEAIPLVISYFISYPLKTNKMSNYLLWVDIFKLITLKEHLTSEGLQKIREIISKININNSKNKRIGHSLR